MKVRNNRLYPYPVLSNEVDDYIENTFNVETELDYDSAKAYIRIKSYIKDIYVLDLIKEGKIGLFCHVECSTTKYRELFELQYDNEKEMVVEIDLCKLTDTIEVLSTLIAKERIINYKNDNLNDFYKDEEINIPQYATFGFSNTFEFVLTKRIDVKGEVPSIFSINKSETGTELCYEANNDQIHIFLPKEEHAIYFAKQGKWKRLKQQMIILPVLVEIFDEIKKDASAYEGTGWYTVLEESLKKLNCKSGFDDVAFQEGQSLIWAQKCLGALLKDAFNEFDKATEV